jgi:hypothetical protein
MRRIITIIDECDYAVVKPVILFATIYNNTQ